MRIVVVGPGAIGILYAAALARSDGDVILLDHNPARAAALSVSGLRVDTPSGESRVWRPAVTGTPPSHTEPAAAVILCVKAFDTLEAARHARAFIGRHTLLVSLQNGIGLHVVLATAFPDSPLACATTNTGATLLAPGHVRQVGPASIAIAACSAAGEAGCDGLCHAMRAAGIVVDTFRDAEALVWTKAIVNAGINPVTALLGIRNGEILERGDARTWMNQAVREGEAVAKAAGIGLLVDDVVAEAERVCRATAQNTSSMLQDVRHGRRTEIDAINGAINMRGEQVGIDTPVNRELVARVKTLCDGA